MKNGIELMESNSITFKCIYCNKINKVSIGKYRPRLNNNGVFCNRSCAAKYQFLPI